MTTSPSDPDAAPSANIDARIVQLSDWRGKLLARLRGLVCAADDGIVEEWKWNVPVWSCHGPICTGETYKHAVKLTFMGALRCRTRPVFSTPRWMATRDGDQFP